RSRWRARRRSSLAWTAGGARTRRRTHAWPGRCSCGRERLPRRSSPALTPEPPMNYRALGRTGLKVSEIALGSWTTFGGSVGEAASPSVIRRAFELGINLFDPADVYVRGAAEIALGKAIQGLPREQL